jgi:hypothetical protein
VDLQSDPKSYANSELKRHFNQMDDGVKAMQVPFVTAITARLRDALIEQNMFRENAAGLSTLTPDLARELDDLGDDPRARLSHYADRFIDVTWDAGFSTMMHLLTRDIYGPIANAGQRLTVRREKLKVEMDRRMKRHRAQQGHGDFRRLVLDDLIGNVHFKRCRTDMAFRHMSQLVNPAPDRNELQRAVSDVSFDRFLSHGKSGAAVADLELVLTGTRTPYLTVDRADLWYLDRFFAVKGHPGRRQVRLKDFVWDLPAPNGYEHGATLRDLLLMSDTYACPASVENDIELHAELFGYGVRDPCLLDFSVTHWAANGLGLFDRRRSIGLQ